MDKLTLQRERAQFNRAIAELINRAIAELIDERLAALPERERVVLVELARETARAFPHLGAAGAMELMYKLGSFLNDRKARLPE